MSERVSSRGPVVYSRPLPPGEHRSALIDCVVGMCEDFPGEYLTAHWVFVRKVLREPVMEAFAIAARFRRTPLTREACELLCNDWYEEAA